MDFKDEPEANRGSGSILTFSLRPVDVKGLGLDNFSLNDGESIV